MFLILALIWLAATSTVDSRFCGHPREKGLVSVIARVRNSGVRERKIVFSLKLMK